MNIQYTRRLLMGLATFLPGIGKLSHRTSGGTSSAFYCYSTWLRHRRFMVENGFPPPRVVAELGPGDSLGTGLAALVTGADHYYAFDIRRYAEESTNVEMLARLTELFSAREPISTCVYESPALRNTDFPDDLNMDSVLAPARLDAIRSAAANTGVEARGLLVSYEPDWTTRTGPPERPDAIVSQAVLEHVDDLPSVYAAMHEWVRPGGCVSHEIDFTSHGFARAWNGHWSFSDRQWRLIRGRRQWAINRQPLTAHLALLERAGFAVVDVQRSIGPTFDRAQLAARFTHLGDVDLTTASAYILARRAGP